MKRIFPSTKMSLVRGTTFLSHNSGKNYVVLNVYMCSALLLNTINISIMNSGKKPIVFCWSSGKDSAYALFKLLQSNEYDVRYLLTTVYKPTQRISMHGIHERVLQKQAEHMGIPLQIVYMNEASNLEYETVLKKALLQFKQQGINTIAFGDIFLEDVKMYREKQLARVGIHALFPLWKQNTKTLAYDFINAGFKTMVCSAHDGLLNDSFVGVPFNHDFLERLPKNVDACGEHGEFHTFCYDGPISSKAVPIFLQEICYKPIPNTESSTTDQAVTKGFWYCNIDII
jgi:uncharacterized protein (TIGR00290 family)